MTPPQRVYWDTAWTSQTLLAREKRAALEAQKEDGQQRLFEITAEEVGKEVPEYLSFVEAEIRKHGRNHPFVKTQYFCEEIDAEGGMFPPARQALMRGDHQYLDAPEPGQLYAFLIDVAGEDESASADVGRNDISSLSNPQRDSTALTIVEIDLSTLEDDLIQAPSYLVRHRKLWTGTRHTALYAQLKALYELWDPRYIVIDATGVGAGLASFLEKSFPHKVLPFLFNSATKSKLGWDFLAVVETGRFKDHAKSKGHSDPVSERIEETALSKDTVFATQSSSSQQPIANSQELFYSQLTSCQMEISIGPNRSMKWGVPDGTRDESSGELLHDDLVISAAMCALLDEQEWGRAESSIIDATDPLKDLGEVF